MRHARAASVGRSVRYGRGARLLRCVSVLALAVSLGLSRLDAQCLSGIELDGLSPALSAAPRTESATSTRLFTSNDALLGLGFSALTFAAFPADRYLARHLRNANTTPNRLLDRAATSVELISTPGSFIIGGALYAAGRLTGRPQLADLGWHGTEALLLSSAITGTLKGVLGRQRPFATADTNARDFKLGGGFHETTRVSFPSGHTTTAFAAAASATSEVQHLWPRATWVVGPVLYTGAALVGLSRMYHDQHWASDVVVGAAIGTFTGLKVVHYAHQHPDNALDRAILGTGASANASSVMLRWAVPSPW